MFFNFNKQNVSVDNIYKLDGRVPLAKAIPFGIQHVLAMFVSNVVPLIIISGVAVYNGVPFTPIEKASLIQNCMLIAGIATLIQLYPIWRIGSRLPVVMGVSFTFVTALTVIAAQDFGMMLGAVIAGGIFEGILGLMAKYWRRFVTPIVCACVVTTIGFSLLQVGVNAFMASGAYPNGAWQNLVVAGITLVSCLLFQGFAKGFLKQLNILFGLVVGYIAAIAFGMVDFSTISSTIQQMGVVSTPMLFHFKPSFELGSIISITLISIVSAAETIGDTTAICKSGVGRDITEKEISGSLACDGFLSAVSGAVFSCAPITSFSQNVGLVAMTHVVNRFSIMCGAVVLILTGLFPPLGAVFSTLPSCVLGGCTVMMFGSIIVSGIGMFADCDMRAPRNVMIAALAFSLGIGVTAVDGFFSDMPKIVGDIFGKCPVAGVFVIALMLSLILPKTFGVIKKSTSQDAPKQENQTDENVISAVKNDGSSNENN